MRDHLAGKVVRYMGHTPFGYRIEKGIAVIDETAARQVKEVYQNYLEGDSLIDAGKKAGLPFCHSSIGKILRNNHYLGDDYYPAIIDPDLFAAVEEERRKRVNALGRNRIPKTEPEVIYPTSFYRKEATENFDDPFQQAEYAYSLIERRENAGE